jgi:hypothetical protein
MYKNRFTISNESKISVLIRQIFVYKIESLRVTKEYVSNNDMLFD